MIFETRQGWSYFHPFLRLLFTTLLSSHKWFQGSLSYIDSCLVPVTRARRDRNDHCSKHVIFSYLRHGLLASNFGRPDAAAAAAFAVSAGVAI